MKYNILSLSSSFRMFVFFFYLCEDLAYGLFVLLFIEKILLKSK
jgi:hypothetical protein